MNYTITHRTAYSYSAAAPVCHNLVHLTPRTLPYQQCHDFRLLVTPEPQQITVRTDYFGNQSSYFSIDQSHRQLTITGVSNVSVLAKQECDHSATDPWDAVSARLTSDPADDWLDAFQFVTESASVRPFEALRDYALQSFPKGRPVLEGVMELTCRIYEDFTYDPTATTINTPLQDVFQQRRGVCQDFAHLQIGCLRSIGLAARYVSGYLRTMPPPGKPRLVGVDASHAWLAVYCGDAGWVDMDPTNGVRTGADHVTVAWGRDYYDVCPIQGVIVGGGEHRMTVSVDVAPSDDETDNNSKTPSQPSPA